MLRRFSRLPAIAWLLRLVVALSIILSATRETGSRGTKQTKSFLFVAAATAAVAKEDNNQVSLPQKVWTCSDPWNKMNLF